MRKNPRNSRYADLIKDQMELKNMKQVELANILAIKPDMLSKYLTKTIAIPDAIIKHIELYFGIDLQDMYSQNIKENYVNEEVEKYVVELEKIKHELNNARAQIVMLKDIIQDNFKKPQK